MALTILPTVLTREEAIRFRQQVEAQVNIPVILKSSPKIHESIKYAREFLNRQSSGSAESVEGAVAGAER